MNDWIIFIVSAAVIVAAGIKLTHCTDLLAEKYQLGKAWLGVILLGVVTSLPEAVASIYTIAVLNASDLAVGNILGSNNFNPLILAIMDMCYRQGSVTNQMNLNHNSKVARNFFYFLSGLFMGAMILSYFNVGGILVSANIIGIIVYVFGILKLDKSQEDETSQPQGAQKDSSLKKIVLGLGFSALFVILGAVWLSQSAEAIAEQTGMGQTFVGSLLLAFVTSLPEIVVSLSALHLGSFSLAVGNVFGSNMTNMLILNLSAFFSKEGSLIVNIRPTHMITLVLSWIMVFIAAKGVSSHSKKPIGPMAWDGWLMWICFIIGMIIVYQLR